MTDNTIDGQGASATPKLAKQPSVGKSVTYVCRYCGEPLEIEGQYRLMMEHFGMPANSGAHAKCLGMGNDLAKKDVV